MMSKNDHGADRTRAARHMALALGLFAAAIYLAYILFWAFKASV